MKNISLFCLLIISSLHSQIDSTALSFYPLNIGNYWEYELIFIDPSWTWEYSYESKEVIGDTLMPNGKLYYVIETKSIPDTSYTSYEYQRIDSLLANVYGYFSNYGFPDDEYLVDSLCSQPGDTSKALRGSPPFWEYAKTICFRMYTDTLFGLPFLTKEFTNMSWMPGLHYHLSSGLGFSHYLMSEIWESSGWLKYAIIGGKSYGTPISIRNQNQQVHGYYLNQNYPNPFNSWSEISYEIPKLDYVNLVVYDIMGRKRKTIYSDQQEAGIHKIKLDASDLPSGIYFYQLRTNEFQNTKRCLIIR